MDILISCLLIVTILPFLAKIPVAIAMNRLDGYDNNHPREQQSRLTGFGARALAAHQNAFEALIIFAPAILVAIATQNTGSLIQNLAMTHIVARILYNIFYLLNIGVVRSLVWGVGLICSLTIIWQCLSI